MLDPPARGFRPRRDVDLFLDRDCKNPGQGFLPAVEILKQILDRDAESHQHPDRHKSQYVILEEIKLDFMNWLAESKYMLGLTSIPPSRFSKHNSNGLWEYSPLLCGTGLAEGLVLAQRISMFAWDRMAEPTLAVHLHNMLVHKRYIEEPLGLLATFQNLLPESFFLNGVPKSSFYSALVKQIHTRHGPVTVHERCKVLASAVRQVRDTHHWLDIRLNQFFKTKTTLMMYHDADWVPERIPESEVKFPMFLNYVRLHETKRVIDRTTGETRFDATDLVQRMKAQGFSEQDLTNMASIVSRGPKNAPNAASMAALARYKSQGEYKDYRDLPAGSYNPYHTKQKDFLSGRRLLGLLRGDIFADVCGSRPSLNYIGVTIYFMMLFQRFEDRLKEIRHPLYVQIYEEAPASAMRDRRSALIMAAMADEDPGTLKIFAEIFQNLRAGVFGFIFWETLRETEIGLKDTTGPDEAAIDGCSVM